MNEFTNLPEEVLDYIKSGPEAFFLFFQNKLTFTVTETTPQSSYCKVMVLECKESNFFDYVFFEPRVK